MLCCEFRRRVLEFITATNGHISVYRSLEVVLPQHTIFVVDGRRTWYLIELRHNNGPLLAVGDKIVVVLSFRNLTV